MTTKRKTAIVLGSTGLTGNCLLQKLLEDDRYKCIKLLSRKSCELSHPKIREQLIDLFELDKFDGDFVADQVFCCIGTTKAKTPNKKTYKSIDYGIPVAAARLCKKNNIPTFVVISALGANKKSNIFYNRIKGIMEEAVLKCAIDHTYILQPSLISGKRREKRTGEWIFKQLAKAMKILMIGPLKKYQAVPPEKIATTMIYLANSTEKSARISNLQIHEIANKDD